MYVYVFFIRLLDREAKSMQRNKKILKNVRRYEKEVEEEKENKQVFSQSFKQVY